MDIAPAAFLPERLTKARLAAGFTSQAKLAKAVGVQQPTMNAYERGRAKPGAETINKIAQVTRRPIGYFYGLEGPDAGGASSLPVPEAPTDNEVWLMGLVVRLEAGDTMSPDEQLRLGQLMKRAIIGMGARLENHVNIAELCEELTGSATALLRAQTIAADHNRNLKDMGLRVAAQVAGLPLAN